MSKDKEMTAQEVASEFGVSEAVVRWAYRMNYLPGRRVGKRLLVFRRSDVTVWSQSEHRKPGPKKKLN